MIRTDICPNCKTALRWEPPDVMVPAKWVCPRCKFKRFEGVTEASWLDRLIRNKRR